MNWLNSLLKRGLVTEGSLKTTAQVSEKSPVAIPNEMAAPASNFDSLPPGEAPGRHFSQQRTQPAQNFNRVPLDMQNAIFFSGMKKDKQK